MAREIRIEVLGDSKNFTRAMGEAEGASIKLESELEDLGRKARAAGDGLDGTAEAGGSAEQALRGVSDLTGVLGAQMGLQTEAIQQWTGQLGEVGGGIEGLLKGGPEFVKSLVAGTTAVWAQVVALTAQAAAFIVANAPLLLLIAGFAALAAGVVLVVKHWDVLAERFPRLAEQVAEIQAQLQPFITWISSVFVPKVQEIAAAFLDGVQKAVQFVAENWPKILGVIKPGLDAILLVVEAVFVQIGIQIETAIKIIKGIIDVFIGVLTGDWERAWDGIKEIVGAAWDGMKATIENAASLIKGLAPLLKEAGQALGDALLEGLKNALSATAGFAGDVGQAVLAAVKAVVNQVIDDINGALQFKIPVRGLPDIVIDAPDIPRLAQGGIVTRPTLALIGEQGPELVVPLDRANQALGGMTVNINGDVYARDPSERALASGDLGFLTGLRAKGMV